MHVTPLESKGNFRQCARNQFARRVKVDFLITGGLAHWRKLPLNLRGVTSHKWNSYVSHMNTSCRRKLPEIALKLTETALRFEVCHMAHMKELCLTHECVVSCTAMCRNMLSLPHKLMGNENDMHLNGPYGMIWSIIPYWNIISFLLKHPYWNIISLPINQYSHIRMIMICRLRCVVHLSAFVWFIRMSDMTHSFICVTWLTHICDLPHSYVWHDSFICVTWLIKMWDMTHWDVGHDSLRCVTWLIEICDVTH